MAHSSLVYRAAKIWGMHRIVGTFPQRDGSLGLSLLRLGRNGDDTRDRAGSVHALNKDGVPICHIDCQRLAEERDRDQPE